MQSPFILLLMTLVPGLLLMFLSGPLIMGRVPRNGWYGFRVPKTLSSDEIWYPANRYAGYQLLHAGRFIVLGSLALMLVQWILPISEAGIATAILFLTLIPLSIAVYRSFRYLRRL
jgi:uncharacterized membrane protein